MPKPLELDTNPAYFEKALWMCSSEGAVDVVAWRPAASVEQRRSKWQDSGLIGRSNESRCERKCKEASPEEHALCLDQGLLQPTVRIRRGLAGWLAAAAPWRHRGGIKVADGRSVGSNVAGGACGSRAAGLWGLIAPATVHGCQGARPQGCLRRARGLPWKPGLACWAPSRQLRSRPSRHMAGLGGRSRLPNGLAVISANQRRVCWRQDTRGAQTKNNADEQRRRPSAIDGSTRALLQQEGIASGQDQPSRVESGRVESSCKAALIFIAIDAPYWHQPGQPALTQRRQRTRGFFCGLLRRRH
ncbi:uncharacterized protein BJ171DRAFT_43068 [Polychytrium aggregatum]|uniref:uncharacterized protein n=1 Tax=Polychytrium aggregatum TaxID=110093 RepID=UPI0022FF21D1|nr:uncharacterized protein BJ171DRAFT_43068 [Polychytrium aggregatum]KAI9206204.1 hypothetical protein BJ171DRAFT_43068 [Polychytrium aggregatum]